MASPDIRRYSIDSSLDSNEYEDALLGHYKKRYQQGYDAVKRRKCSHPLVYFLSGLFAGLILIGIASFLYVKNATYPANVSGEVNGMVPRCKSGK